MKKFELLAASAIALIAAVPAAAQTTPPQGAPAANSTNVSAPGAAIAPTGDEIIVTAAKREQTLQDVPISVSVTGVDTIEKAQIVDLKDLQSVVPSLKVNQFQSAGQTNFTIRGFGNGNGNIGIESSVGVFIDGVYRSRSASAIADLPDVQRIEVLRGPQSTLFGKNVSAGAISIVTKKPQFDWGLSAEATAGNYGLIQANASITGPISESLAFRIYGNVNQRDGYFNNVVTGGDVNGKNRYAVRADLLFEPSSDVSVRIIADVNHINEVCCGATSIFNGPRTQIIGLPRAVGGVGGTIGDTTRIYDRNLVYNTAPNNVLTGKGISGQIDLTLGSFGKLTSITAYRSQSNATTLDVDFTGADISNQTTSDKIKTFSQELRLTSTGDGPFSYLIGAFYAHENINTVRDIRFGRDARRYVDGLLNALTGAALTATSPLATLETLQRLGGNTAVVPGGTYFQAGQGINDAYTLKDDSASIFGQLDYTIGGLTITAGAAYLHDRKQAASNVVLNDPFSSLNLNNVPELANVPLFVVACPGSVPGCVPNAARVPVNLFAGLNAVQFFYGNTPNHAPINFPNAAEDGILRGSKFVYTGRLAYKISSAFNVYATYSTGWKAGAYNLSSDSRPPSLGVGRTADPENVTVYEAGVKSRFSGGFLNIAVFKQTIRGFQSNAFTGIGFSLVNAGKQSVRGVEVDAQYRPFSALVLNGAVTYLDPKYDSFTRATCSSFAPECQVPAGSPAGTLPPAFRDLSGRRPAGIPEFSATVSAIYTQDLGGGYNAFLRGEYDFVSRTTLSDLVPAALNTFTVNNVNASLGISTPYKLDVQFWVRNLTKNNYLTASFVTVIQDGSYSGYPNEPRTYGVTLRKTF